jgi:hypothetical protein
MIKTRATDRLSYMPFLRISALDQCDGRSEKGAVQVKALGLNPCSLSLFTIRIIGSWNQRDLMDLRAPGEA